MKALKKCVIWILLGILTGAVCGLIGALFSKTIGFVTNIRVQNNWILYLLSIGGLISVGIYKLCRIKGVGTVSVFESARTELRLPHLLAPAIFTGTAISHLFGASAGREGAALQIGGGVANSIATLFKLDEDSRHITIMCGMAALFSAVFGTPLAACAFVIEVILTRLCISAAIPVLISSIAAFLTASALGVHPERFNIGALPNFSVSLVLKTALITLLSVAVGFVFCKGLALGGTFAKKLFKNEFLRITIGGAVIIILTLIIGNYDYNGGGIDIIEHVFEGSVNYEAFALKILFTVICVSAGFKGGEIIPTLFIGATFGGALALVLGVPVGIGAATGMAVLFCAGTKCPIATILLCGEMFGFYSMPLIIPVVIVGFALARYKGLYGKQKDIIILIKEHITGLPQ